MNLNISGFNVAHRRRKTGMVGFQHRLTKEDAMKWFQQKVCVTIM
jgi:large subunit ribosomal protein L11e